MSIPIPFPDGSTHHTTQMREEFTLAGGPGRWVGDGVHAEWEPLNFRIKWQDQNWWLRHQEEFRHYAFGGWLNAQPIGFVLEKDGRDLVLKVFDCTNEKPGPDYIDGVDAT